MILDKNKTYLCIPVCAETTKELKKALDHAVSKAPDLIELRYDYFKDGIDPFLNTVYESEAKNLIFTFRSKDQGSPFDSSGEERLKAIKRADRSGLFDLLDVEDSLDMEMLVDTNRLIRSFHDFGPYKGKEKNKQRLLNLKEDGVLKGAFNVDNAYEFNDMVGLASELRRIFPERVFILIAMGEAGKQGRLFPEMLGSSVTFVSDVRASAPGQIDIDTWRKLRR